MATYGSASVGTAVSATRTGLRCDLCSSLFVAWWIVVTGRPSGDRSSMAAGIAYGAPRRGSDLKWWLACSPRVHAAEY